MTFLSRRQLLPSLLVALVVLVAPASALAERPVLMPPPRAQLIAGQAPLFTWTNGAFGENVTLVTIKPSNYGERGYAFDVEPGATSGYGPRILVAGSYSWDAQFRQLGPDGVEISGGNVDGPDFVVPAIIAPVKLQTPIQNARTPRLTVRGTYVTTYEKMYIVCTVRSGRKVVASKTLSNVYPRGVGKRTGFRCNMSIPESHDGRSLKATAVLSGYANKPKRVSRSQSFIAR